MRSFAGSQLGAQLRHERQEAGVVGKCPIRQKNPTALEQNFVPQWRNATLG